jgi:ribosomal protein L29
MKLTDIRSKNDKELRTLINDSRKQLAESWIDMSTKKISNVKQIKGLKVTIARALTEQRERELKKLEESNG